LKLCNLVILGMSLTFPSVGFSAGPDNTVLVTDEECDALIAKASSLSESLSPNEGDRLIQCYMRSAVPYEPGGSPMGFQSYNEPHFPVGIRPDLYGPSELNM